MLHQPIIAHFNNDSVVYVYDTVFVPDTLFVTDTLEIFTPNDSATNTSKSKFSLGMQYGMGKSYGEYQITNRTLQQRINKVHKNGEVQNFSVLANWQINRTNALQIGTEINWRTESLSNTPNNQLLKPYYSERIDTIETHYQITGQDTTVIFITENITDENYDTLPIATPYTNKLHYIGIPLNYRFTIPLNKIGIIIHSGLTPVLVLNPSNNIYLNENGYFQNFNDQQFNGINLNGQSGISLNYPLFINWHIETGLTMKYSFFSIYQNDFIYKFKPLTVQAHCAVYFTFK